MYQVWDSTSAILVTVPQRSIATSTRGAGGAAATAAAAAAWATAWLPQRRRVHQGTVLVQKNMGPRLRDPQQINVHVRFISRLEERTVVVATSATDFCPACGEQLDPVLGDYRLNVATFEVTIDCLGQDTCTLQCQILSCFRVTESVIQELWKHANYPIINSGYFRRLRPRGGRPKLLRE